MKNHTSPLSKDDIGSLTNRCKTNGNIGHTKGIGVPACRALAIKH